MDGPSVRGEALIYGNPAGCNFISYGHSCVVLAGKQKYNLIHLGPAEPGGSGHLPLSPKILVELEAKPVPSKDLVVLLIAPPDFLTFHWLHNQFDFKF